MLKGKMKMIHIRPNKLSTCHVLL